MEAHNATTEAQSETLRVHLVDDIGVHKNRPNATLQITASEFVIRTADKGEERFSRKNHDLVTPEL